MGCGWSGSVGSLYSGFSSGRGEAGSAHGLGDVWISSWGTFTVVSSLIVGGSTVLTSTGGGGSTTCIFIRVKMSAGGFSSCTCMYTSRKITLPNLNSCLRNLNFSGYIKAVNMKPLTFGGDSTGRGVGGGGDMGSSSCGGSSSGTGVATGVSMSWTSSTDCAVIGITSFSVNIKIH